MIYNYEHVGGGHASHRGEELRERHELADSYGADAFVSRIAEIAAQEAGTLVMPMTEATTLALSLHRDSIYSAGGCMVLPTHQQVLRAFDKQQTTELAQSLGIRSRTATPTASSGA